MIKCDGQTLQGLIRMCYKTHNYSASIIKFHVTKYAIIASNAVEEEGKLRRRRE